MKKTRVIILIDGSNFYFKLKSLDFRDLLLFNFKEFAQFIARNAIIISSRYYVGKVRQDGSKKADRMASNQQKLFSRLRKSNFTYVLGYLLKSDTDLAPAIAKAQEKGKIVEYVGFSHQPSVAMVSFCRESRLLTKEELGDFFDNNKKRL